MMVLSGLLALVCQLAGLALAYYFDISATASIILVAALLFILSLKR